MYIVTEGSKKKKRKEKNTNADGSKNPELAPNPLQPMNIPPAITFDDPGPNAAKHQKEYSPTPCCHVPLPS